MQDKPLSIHRNLNGKEFAVIFITMISASISLAILFVIVTVHDESTKRERDRQRFVSAIGAEDFVGEVGKANVDSIFDAFERRAKDTVLAKSDRATLFELVHAVSDQQWQIRRILGQLLVFKGFVALSSIVLGLIGVYIAVDGLR